MFQARRPAGFDLVGVVILKSRSATATSVTLAYGAPPVASLLARSQTLKPNDTSASTTARPDATSPTRIAPSDLSRTSTRDENTHNPKMPSTYRRSYNHNPGPSDDAVVAPCRDH